MLEQNSACARLPRRGLILATALFSLCLLLATRTEAASDTAGDTFPASVSAAGAFADTGTSPPISISGDGRYVAFVSAAENLSDEAPTGMAEVYVKDLETGEVKLVSRGGGETGAAAEPEPIGEHQARQIESAAISGNGRYVVFASTAHNLVGGLPLPSELAEERFVDHLYRRDLQTGETVLLDRVTGATGAVVGVQARVAAISDDGRYVAFGAQVDDLEEPAAAHEEGNETLYVRDMQEGTTTAVGRGSDEGGEAGELASEGSFDGEITPDGRYVVFSTPSANLDPEANGLFQVYRRDLQSGETVLLSRTNPTGSAPAGEPSDGEAFEPSFVGGDGCRVAFTAIEASNLFGGGAPPTVATYLRNLCANPPSTALISLDEEGQPFDEGVFAGAAGDGHEVLLEASLAGHPRHIYLHDLDTGETTLVDRATGAAGAAGDLGAERGAISANGCRAVFTSGATNLSAEAPPASGSSQLLQAYARQLAPCKPAAEEGGEGSGGGKGGGGGPSGGPVTTPPPLSVGVKLLTHSRLWLDFDGGATATVQIRQVLGRRHRLRLVKAFEVEAHGAEVVKLALPHLPHGHYRVSIRLQAPEARAMTFPLDVKSVRRRR